MSNVRRERPGHPAPVVPLVEREDGSYGFGRYVWLVIVRRPGSTFSRRFTVRTHVCRRSSARHMAQQVLDARDVHGFHYIATTVVHVDKEQQS